jgi:hypothetical protein
MKGWGMEVHNHVFNKPIYFVFNDEPGIRTNQDSTMFNSQFLTHEVFHLQLLTQNF